MATLNVVEYTSVDIGMSLTPLKMKINLNYV